MCRAQNPASAVVFWAMDMGNLPEIQAIQLGDINTYTISMLEFLILGNAHGSCRQKFAPTWKNHMVLVVGQQTYSWNVMVSPNRSPQGPRPHPEWYDFPFKKTSLDDDSRSFG